ncbi:HD-GYP domain-containing protein [Butyrivibrio sp. FCS014]|uniref:HD-GYP domain-containing protein n=1 Tax=Butyrivibrio sp. FCS014 TaxID=1408304 RepID=UPI000467899E|nr:HD domain-containing phosphohydrolase [Butyrivibrio sp. FCS014]
MDINFRRLNRSSFRCKVYGTLCIILNVSLAYMAHTFGLPLYLDTIGTIIMASLGGFLPGIFVAVFTSLLCCFFSGDALYYTLSNVMAALVTVWFVRAGGFRKKKNPVIYFILLVVLTGLYNGGVQWLLSGGPSFSEVVYASYQLSAKTHIGYVAASLLIDIGLNALDKATTALIALFIILLIPEAERKAIWDSNWKQAPVSRDEMYERVRSANKRTIQKKMGMILSVTALLLVIVMVWTGISVFYSNTKAEYTDNARKAARFAASVVDGDRIDDYITKGRAVPGYEQTEALLYKIRDNVTGLKYLYVIRVTQDSIYYVFDLHSGDFPAMEPGDAVPVESYFEPYLEGFLAGREIEPIESDNISGWVMAAYYPIKDSSGKTVAYAGADSSMVIMSDYTKEYLLKIFLIFSGFFVLILGYGIWNSGFYLSYPITSMTKCVQEFVDSDRDQKSLDDNVKKIRALDIHTMDDVEDLYKAICEMEANMTEQMRELRHYADATSKMQSGLIITMADLVENRDSDTAAHIQKTAAYVKIIVEALKRKGYYAEKITPSFENDIVNSAPLHDIGKIHIPDAILNKPGKLTPEEFEIMKTHTTAGMNIMEKAINTTQGESYLKEARNMAAYHHERWDGKGYPEGLHGQVIPLSARIMAVADVFDALVSKRIYKPAFSFEKALEIIQEGSGTQFDPKCVEAFMDSLTEVRIVLKTFQEM